MKTELSIAEWKQTLHWRNPTVDQWPTKGSILRLPTSPQEKMCARTTLALDQNKHNVTKCFHNNMHKLFWTVSGGKHADPLTPLSKTEREPPVMKPSSPKSKKGEGNTRAISFPELTLAYLVTHNQQKLNLEDPFLLYPGSKSRRLERKHPLSAPFPLPI